MPPLGWVLMKQFAAGSFTRCGVRSLLEPGEIIKSGAEKRSVWALFLHIRTGKRMLTEFFHSQAGSGPFISSPLQFHLQTLNSKFSFFILAGPSDSTCSPRPSLVSSQAWCGWAPPAGLTCVAISSYGHLSVLHYRCLKSTLGGSQACGPFCPTLP